MAKHQNSTRIVMPDVHVPFEDTKLVRLWLDHARSLKPDGVDILGDLLDCYVLSRFSKDPNRKKVSLQDEVDRARLLLASVREAVGPKCDIRYSEGNHEDRLRKMLWGSARELGTLRRLTIPELLGLDDLGIRYYSLRHPYCIGSLQYMHGDTIATSHGGATAIKIAKRVNRSVIIGHSHRIGIANYRTWTKNLCGIEAGCLCRMDPEYIAGVPNWHQGWPVVYFRSNGEFEVRFTSIDETARHRFVYFGGKLLGRIPQGVTR